MAARRLLALSVEIWDDGGPDDYDLICERISEIGGDIVDEVDITP